MATAASTGPGKEAFAPSASPPRGPDAASKVDAVLAERVEARGPGAAVIVMKRGEVVVAKGYGLADIARGAPITPRTRFDLASVSKQFTAFAILLLEDRGALHIEDTARTYLPELPPYDASHPIRLVDMLHMTSGLSEYTTRLDDFDDASALTNKDVLAFAAKRPLDFPTGTKNEYVNTNYVLLSLVVERVSKKPFGAFLRDEVFAPLGMTTIVLDRKGIDVADRAQGYDRRGKGKRARWEAVRNDVPVTGDGNLFASVEDLAKWVAALRAGKLLKPEVASRGLERGRLRSGDAFDYGFGWDLGDVAGRKAYSHSGGWTGTSTFLARFPDDDLAVIVLSNDESFDASDVGEEIAKRFVGGG